MPASRLTRAALTAARSGPPSAAGRWSRLPERDPNPTRRTAALAEALLERHGVVTRGAVAAEGAPGGFAAVYPVLAALEERGTARRGYFVEGLGAAQFAVPGAVDRLRALGERSWPETPSGRVTRDRAADGALVLAATDPANPFGAALPWPERVVDEGEPGKGHRPGRKAGALVVIVAGELALYVERGGRTLLSYLDDSEYAGRGGEGARGRGPQRRPRSALRRAGRRRDDSRIATARRAHRRRLPGHTARATAAGVAPEFGGRSRAPRPLA